MSSDKKISRRNLLQGLGAAGLLAGTATLFQNCAGGFTAAEMQTLASAGIKVPDNVKKEPTPVIQNPPSMTPNPSLSPNPNNGTGKAPFAINGIPVNQWSSSEGTRYSQFEVRFGEALLGSTSATVGIIYTGLGSQVFAGSYLLQSYDNDKLGTDVSEIMVFSKDTRALLGHRKIAKTSNGSVYSQIGGVFTEAGGVQNFNAASFGYQVLAPSEYGPGKSAIVVINDRAKQKYYYKEVSLEVVRNGSTVTNDANLIFAKAAEEGRGTTNLNIVGGPGWIDLPRIPGRNDGGGTLYSGSASFAGHYFNASLSGNSVSVNECHGQSNSHYMHSAYVFDHAGNFLGASPISTPDPFQARSSISVNNLNLTGVKFLRIVQIDTVNGVVSRFIQV